MSETIQTKSCGKCKENKPISEFHKNSSRADGYASNCKLCRKIHEKIYYHTKAAQERRRRYKKTIKGKITKKKYRYSAKGVDAHKKYQQSKKGKMAYKRYYKKHPIEFQARAVIYKAIMSNHIPKATELICDQCNNQAQEYHHPDYSKPLEVIPLCRSCHKRIHTQQ